METTMNTNATSAIINGTANIFGVPQLFTVKDTAKIIKRNKEDTLDLIKSGQLRAIKLGNLKVSSMEINRFLIENEGMDFTDPYNPKPLAF